MKNLRRLNLKPFLLWPNAGALPFTSPPILILARSTDHARTLVTIRLGLFPSATKKLKVCPYERALTPSTQDVLVLGSSLTIETRRGSGVAECRFTSEFRYQRFGAHVVRVLKTREGDELSEALRWGENGDRLSILESRH